MQRFFAASRAWWARMLDGNGRPRNLRLLIEQLNLDNYTFSPSEDGRVAVKFDWPEDLREQNARETTGAGNRINLLTFPYRCRRILDGQEALDPTGLAAFWTGLQWIADLDLSPNGEDPMLIASQRNGVCGGAAALICRYGEWLREAPDRLSWCLSQLRAAAARAGAPQSLRCPRRSRGRPLGRFRR